MMLYKLSVPELESGVERRGMGFSSLKKKKNEDTLACAKVLIQQRITDEMT
jgi:hypothetical protein